MGLSRLSRGCLSLSEEEEEEGCRIAGVAAAVGLDRVEALMIRPRIGTGDQTYPDEEEVVAEDGAEVRADDMD